MRNDKKIAIFFDCENISANHVPSIFDELANYGEVIIKQSFKLGLSKMWDKMYPFSKLASI